MRMDFINTVFAQAIIKANEVGLSGKQVSDSNNALSSIMNTVYFVAGIVAVVGIIIGGYLYVTSMGDPGKVTKAKNAVFYSVIGLVIVFMAFAITQLLINVSQS